jgi:hypothetical protein
MAQREVMKISVRTLRHLIREAVGPNGWWVLRDGTVVNVPRNKEHVDVAAEITGIKDDGGNSTLSPDEALELSGAIRIRNWGDFLSVGARKLDKRGFANLQNALSSIKLNSRLKVSLYVSGTTSYKTTVGDILYADSLKDLTPAY